MTPAAPGTAEGVGDDDGDLDAERVLEPGSDPPSRSIRVVGQQRGRALGDVGQVDTGVGADEAVARLADDEVAASAQNPNRLLGDERELCVGVVVDGHQPAFGLGDDLLRDDDDVTVTQSVAVRARWREGICDQAREIVTGCHLADAGDREDEEGFTVLHRSPPVPGPRPTRVSASRLG